jgi:hypothetical protein
MGSASTIAAVHAIATLFLVSAPVNRLRDIADVCSSLANLRRHF